MWVIKSPAYEKIPCWGNFYKSDLFGNLRKWVMCTFDKYSYREIHCDKQVQIYSVKHEKLNASCIVSVKVHNLNILKL